MKALGRTLTPIDEAIAQLLESVTTLPTIEPVELSVALNRVVAEDQYSEIDVPPAANSAMDGFACLANDLNLSGQTTLPISQRITAGAVAQPLLQGTAARIFTGATIPKGADTVVIQEQCQWNDHSVTINGSVDRGGNIRPQGQDVKRGQCVVNRGTVLKPQHIGLLASIGKANVMVYRRLKVAILTTGNELVQPGEKLSEGKIYNSNSLTMHGLLQQLGCEVMDCGQVDDTPQTISTALLQAANDADCIISTGGVSVGEEDHVKACVQAMGELALWKLAIKPGKPLAFGHVVNSVQKPVPFIGLPGNPASVFVTFLIVIRPFLRALQGASAKAIVPIYAAAAFDRPHAASRQEYLRAILTVEEGGAIVRLTGNQSSGMLSTAVAANGFAIHPLHEAISKGDRVAFLLFDQLMF